MYYVYFLKSKISEATYVGYTANLKLRFSQHNNHLSISTKNNAPWDLIYYEAYKSKNDATRREKMLKYDGRTKSMLRNRIKTSLEI